MRIALTGLKGWCLNIGGLKDGSSTVQRGLFIMNSVLINSKVCFLTRMPLQWSLAVMKSDILNCGHIKRILFYFSNITHY